MWKTLVSSDTICDNKTKTLILIFLIGLLDEMPQQNLQAISDKLLADRVLEGIIRFTMENDDLDLVAYLNVALLSARLINNKKVEEYLLEVGLLQKIFQNIITKDIF